MTMSLQNKRWSDLTSAQKASVILLGVVQLALLAAALVDISRRAADEINGSKKVWAAISFINFVGPIAYFVYGRKR